MSCFNFNIFLEVICLHISQLMVDLLLLRALQQKRPLLIQQLSPVARRGQPSFRGCEQNTFSWNLEHTTLRDMLEDASFS